MNRQMQCVIEAAAYIDRAHVLCSALPEPGPALDDRVRALAGLVELALARLREAARDGAVVPS